MLEVTPAALSNIKDYLRQQKIDSPIRITMISGGCGGPSLGLAIDEALENDDNFDHDGVTFVVDKSLFVTCGTVKVDFIEKSAGGCGCGGSGGFSITSEKPLSSGGCSCSCSSGSCG
ncbi:MAG: IscA/HesB family protein [Proteobacteria bacterium]|nr:IscA/HesB family protein [Pseudomonadota bacterium]MBU1639406.1 IscA/HesB family protein [Pseudomonadota bacterium]